MSGHFRIKRWVRFVHRWLAVLIGGQVLLWLASGVVMSWFPIDVVRGEDTAPVVISPAIAARNYASPGGVIAQMDDEVIELRLRTIGGRLVYEAIARKGRALFDPATGNRIQQLDEAGARQAAQLAYIGDGEIEAVSWQTQRPSEYRGTMPVWRADFDDADRTRLYISPATGEVASRRTRIWRVYDFFWMLHIMDYEAREDFNNPLLRATAVCALLFALTGVALAVFRFAPKRKPTRTVTPPPADPIATSAVTAGEGRADRAGGDAPEVQT